MGDVVGLVETAIEKVNQEDMQAQAMKMMSGQFDLNDLMKQLEQMDQMGDIKGIMKMIPGISNFSKQIDEAKATHQKDLADLKSKKQNIYLL